MTVKFLKSKLGISSGLLIIAVSLIVILLSGCTTSDNQPSSTDKCYDINADHKCDVCQRVLNECIDIKIDHACDVCGLPALYRCKNSFRVYIYRRSDLC